MQSYSLFAPAKINLHLEIIGDRADGYHQLVMIMQSVNLGDIIHLRANGTDSIRLYCQNPQVPLDNTNLAYKAVRLMQEKFPKSAHNFGGLDITIEKNIPVAAGLAGGSTNAAAVLVGINLMWSLGLTQPELRDLGALLGSDVPFCISGGTAIATGRGEEIEPLPDLTDIWVILAKYNNLGVSTPWAYNTYREQYNHLYVCDGQGIKQRTHAVHSGNLVKAILKRNSEEIGALLYNDLEKVVLPEYPFVSALITAFKKENVLGAMMSGSGPTVFALCATEQIATSIADIVEKNINDSNLSFWVTQMCPHGIITISNE
ncbi:4-(cytidine 5'-diphospho)-2-C-methyl-D-erythritol kinase [Geminocystis sp. NIES-3709]|uniref:4-(cytidine 5'-diphospho)-2-C-methyl-D-erythritol kinase n=1 Tax=Geminocystis sp. NIES-3709 TaxID=1617448 RepID=UPI0005FC7796|nr:4-(cytidine 5'-diphospho)-2-C-methyl-D-erythritol kinase [Geminocystis sp. NIES-3709]BAQ64147.1 4-diphosphocytidyl-2-C-methyl-D-erythritol kinase [Geminocystis sp. NIES-3709]